MSWLVLGFGLCGLGFGVEGFGFEASGLGLRGRWGAGFVSVSGFRKIHVHP